MRISDWSSDVCSSDLLRNGGALGHGGRGAGNRIGQVEIGNRRDERRVAHRPGGTEGTPGGRRHRVNGREMRRDLQHAPAQHAQIRSEEHTSELQSLMRLAYAVFYLTKTKHRLDP